jgi:hypothetical protein
MRSVLLRAAFLASLMGCACLAQAATPRDVSLTAGSVHEKRLEAGAIQT